MKKSFYQAVCLLFSLALCAGVASCSDNDEPSEPTPGKITATGQTVFTSQTMKGTVHIPVTVENPECVPVAEDFVFLDFSDNYEIDLDDGSKAGNLKPGVTVAAVERNGDAGFVIAMEYDYSGYTSASASFTLGYRDTATAIPVTIHCRNAMTLAVTHLVPGAAGKLTLEINPDAGSSGTEECDLTVITLKAQTHQSDISIEVDQDGTCVHLYLDKAFEFTAEEKAKGYATVLMEATLKDDSNGHTFTVGTNLHVCPSARTETITLSADTHSYKWKVDDLAETLGMNKAEDGNLYLVNRNAEFYIARKGEPLVPVAQHQPVVYGGWGSQLTPEPYATCNLLGISLLEPGEYIYVVHMKKDNTSDSGEYVDFVFPFVKE